MLLQTDLGYITWECRAQRRWIPVLVNLQIVQA